MDQYDDFELDDLALPEGDGNPRSTGKVSPAQQGGVVPEGWKPTVAKPLPVVQCTATTRTGPRAGQRCGKWSIAGATVCLSHGANLPRVKEAAQDRVEAARLRMIGLADDAIDTIEDLVTNATQENVRLKAATEILDRVGIKGAPDLTVTVEHTVSPLDAIRDRIATIAKNSQPALEDMGEQDGDAEVLPDVREDD